MGYKLSQNEESLALKVINESLKIPFVKVNRSEFLMKIFGADISNPNNLIEEGPQAFFSHEELDRQAMNRINYAVSQSSLISFATGIPGGLAMGATIPADIAQFYGYSLKLAQEISYIYGYDDIWNNQGQLSEDAKNTLILYLGIMLGVTSAGSITRILSSKLSTQALKKIPSKALTKTGYYSIIKKILSFFGTKLTKVTFAKGISKFIPILGGAVSGGLNFVSMKHMALRLKDELGKSINYSDENLIYDMRILEKEDVEIVTSKTKDNTLIEIEKAYDLLEKKIITEDEFLTIKKSLLSKSDLL